MFVLGWVGIAMGKVCMFMFGWPLWIGLIVFSSVCAIYVLAAGYWGVVMADFQQGIIAFIMILIVSFWGIHSAGGAGHVVERLHEMGEAGKLNPFNFTGFFGGDFPVAWFLTMLFIGILGGLGMGTAIDWFPEAQRIQSARTVKDASWSHMGGVGPRDIQERGLGGGHPRLLRDVSRSSRGEGLRDGLVQARFREPSRRDARILFRGE